jgi:dephospho-CoA kinase
MTPAIDSFLHKPYVIAIVGMAGSGKSEAAQFFREKGIYVLRFGDVIDEGITAEGLPWTPENNVYYRGKIRKQLGMEAVAIKMLPKIKERVEKSKNIIIDGLYSWEEYLYLRKELPQLFLLCIYARPSIRYARLEKRIERPFNKDDAVRRDITEIEESHKAGPIAIANYLVKNETSIKEFKAKLEDFWQILSKKEYI